jgi:ABC-2 type transport system permease protein
MSTITTTTDTDADAPAPQARSIAMVLASVERPTRPSALSQSLTFGMRALLRIRRVPEQFFDVTAFPIIMTLLFTFLFGGAIAGSTENYIAYLAPGILAQSVLFITMYTATTLRTDIDKGVFDRFRSLPIWRPAAIVGMLLGDAVRFAIAAVVTALVCVAVGWRPQGGVVGVALAIALILVFAFALGWIWTFLSMILRTPGSIMGVSSMLIMVFTFGSNIFVDPTTMPGWLQGFVSVNPVTFLVASVRGVTDGTGVGSELVWMLMWAAGLVAVFGSLAMWKYRDPR